MAFPASLRVLQREFENALATAVALKARAQSLRDSSALGNTPRVYVLELQRQLGAALTIWTNAKNTAGMAAYAQEQFANPSLDIAAEFNTMLSAATLFRDWINTNFPRDSGTGAVLMQTSDANGVITDLTFTPAQLAGFRAQADSFIATIG